ncbi:hypothetical protein ACUXCC_002499 [Cytobacillus horneckiae]
MKIDSEPVMKHHWPFFVVSKTPGYAVGSKELQAWY